MPRKKTERKGSYAFSDLKAMPCFKEMDDKVKAGIALEEVARWLQEDMFQQGTIKPESLARKLFRYKAQLAPADLLREPPAYIERAIEKMRRGVNEITELEKLYLLQLRRISIDAETESRINKLFSSTGGEIQIAAGLLNSMMQKKMDLGLMTKATERIELTGGLNLTGLVTDETDEATKAKLGLLAGKMLDAMQKSMDAAPKTDQEVADEADAEEEAE